MQDVYIKGFNKSHGFVVATTKVDDDVLNFELNSDNVIRDVLVENIGEKNVYMFFSKTPVESITISDGTSKLEAFPDGYNYGWKIAPSRPLSLSYCDYTNIGLVCDTGEESIVQIMGILDTDNNNN